MKGQASTVRPAAARPASDPASRGTGAGGNQRNQSRFPQPVFEGDDDFDNDNPFQLEPYEMDDENLDYNDFEFLDEEEEDEKMLGGSTVFTARQSIEIAKERSELQREMADFFDY
jgi:hypothetical protein